MDYAKLSDQELLELAANGGGAPDYSKMSDEELLAAAGDPSPAPKTNPSEKRARKSKSLLESAGAGSAQATTFGYVPQIVGGLAAASDYLRPAVIDPKSGKRIPRNTYIEARDATDKDITEARDDNPGTFAASGIASALLMPGPKSLGAAKNLKGAAGRAALYAGLYNPGETKGEVSPIQPVERGVNALIGAGTGTVAKRFTDMAGNAVRGSRAARELVEPGVEQRLQGEIQNATQAANQNYIAPRAKEARKVLSEKEVTFNPNILEGADEPGLLAALQKRTGAAQKKSRDAAMSGSGQRTPIQPGDELVTLRGDVADRVRKKLDRRADIKQRGALGDSKVDKNARDTFAAANTLRDLRSRAAPELADNFSEQSYGLGLNKEINERSKSPISLLAQPPGGDAYAKIKDLDKFAGTNLSQRGADIRRGQYLLGQEQGQLNTPTKEGLMGYAGRRAAKFASGIPAEGVDLVNRALGDRSLSEAFVRQLVEQIARGK